MKVENLVKGFEKVYHDEKQKECEELHNALVEVVQEHKASVQNALFVLDLIRFELMEAKYKEVMGVVKLTDKPPIGPIKEKE